MKGFLLQLLLLGVISNFAIAQNTQRSDTSYNNDPQVSDQNYKHPNKAAEAIKSGKVHRSKANMVQVEDNSNYKKQFKRDTTSRAKVATPAPTKNRKKDKRNYKHQF